MKRGRFIIIDGIDGSGKTTLVKALERYLKQKRNRVLNLKSYWQKHNSLPAEKELKKYDIIVTAEPSFFLVGSAFRDELIRQTRRSYSAETIAQAFALDRLIMLKRVIIPSLKNNKLVIQDRGITSALVYQPLINGISLKKLKAMEGNRLALKYKPDLVIIAEVRPELAFRRLRKRKHKANVVFERLPFMKRISRSYRSQWFKKLFSPVAYIDANGSIKNGVNQLLELWQRLE